ncbi:TRAP transporter small permease [Gemmobacter nectariphilus]|uniref:TRAP transporter small permease n=1 Tax=Gemmobacter nectariphilus TaxID=220343 RepID=UPI00040BFC07|nr:TRAP transporter small permease subunit [Gemmobacter nectariphilus]
MNDRPDTGLVAGLRAAETLLNRVLAGVTVTLLTLSVALAFVSVVLRYVFGSSWAIIEELCRFFIVYSALLYFGPLITRNAHLTMSIVTDMLPPQVYRLFDLALHLLLVVLLAGLFQAAWQWESGLIAMGLTTMSGEMKAWIPSAALPIGVGIALVYALLRAAYRIAGVPLTQTAGAGE